jgi:phenylpropionate dioxygenase-like ring-hydroxylating dioxygenase large terminal subunit
MDPKLIDPAEIRPDFIPKDAYISREFAELEAKYLWPRVWQMACREEEITNPGQYVTYEVANETIVVLRGKDGEIRAFHNVCPHRGRRLTSGCGQTSEIVCRFHGWRFGLDGKNTHVSDREDWDGALTDDYLALHPVKVGSWGGFVFINMDPDCEPLEKFLDPVNRLCDRFELEKMRFTWYRTAIAPCNWKIPVEGFSESYHVQQSHAHLLQYMQDYSTSKAYGPHGAFWYPEPPEGVSPISPAIRLKRNQPQTEYRKYAVGFLDVNCDDVGAIVSERTRDVVKQRLLAEVAADAPADEVLMKIGEFQRQAAIDDGAGWPEIDAEYKKASHDTWTVFPNFIFVHAMIDSIIVYRARPNGIDPDSCLFDVWSLMRYAPGKEPPLEREFFNHIMDADWRLILRQDFEHFEDVQRGLHSMAYRGHRTNPKQEVIISNHARVLRAFISEGIAKEQAAR